MKATIKKKFDSIDRSKIKVDATKEILAKIEKGLNSKDEANQEKAEALLDKFIAQAKAKNADIFVSAKPQPTKTPAQKKVATQVTKSKLDALMDSIANDPLFKDFNSPRRVKGGGRSDALIDSERKARESGRRVSQKGWKNQYGASKGGRRYYEYRENRIDRKAPSFPNKPWLEDGGLIHPSDKFQDKYSVIEIKGDGSRKVHNTFPDFETAMVFASLKRNVMPSNTRIVVEDEKGTTLYRSFAKGGEIDESTAMILSQNKAIAHHTEELKDALSKNPKVEPWVVAKIERASTDISDVTHYLDGKSEYAKGGKIVDQYEGRTPEDIWNNLDKSQRQHFLYDHKEQIEEYRGEEYGDLSGKEIIKAYNSDWSELDKNIRNRFANHVREGEYAKGGYMADYEKAKADEYPYLTAEDFQRISDKIDKKFLEQDAKSGVHEKFTKYWYNGGREKAIAKYGDDEKIAWEESYEDFKDDFYGGKMADGGYIISGKDEDGFVYILDENGKRVADSKIPSDIGYGKVKNKFVYTKAKYDPTMGRRDAEIIISKMNEKYAKGGEMAKGGMVKGSSILEALSGWNEGRTINGIAENLGLSNYRFGKYATESEMKNIKNGLEKLIKSGYVEEGGVGYKITFKGARHLDTIPYGKREKGGYMARGGTIGNFSTWDKALYYALEGKSILIYSMGVKTPSNVKITGVQPPDTKFSIPSLVLETGNTQERIDGKGKIEDFMNGKEVELYDGKEYYVIQLATKAKSTPKSGDYTNRKSIKLIVIKNPNKNGSKNYLTIDKSDFLNGLHKFEDGGKLSKEYTYIKRSDVNQVVYNDNNKDTIEFKPKNGFWVSKKALVEAGMNETKVESKKLDFGVTNIRKGYNGWIAKNEVSNYKGYDWEISTMKSMRGDLVSTAVGGKKEKSGSGYSMFTYAMYQDPNIRLLTSKPSRITEKVVMEQQEKALAVFEDKVNEKYAKGGKIGFEGLSNKVAKNYEGKKVAPKYRKEYGETYDKEEAKEVGDKVASKVYRQQLAKMEKGGKLPEDLGKYFIKTRKTKVVDMADLIPLRARPTGIENAEKYMRMAYEGKMEKRKPITIYKSQGKYKVYDGNSTYAVAKASGWEKIWAEVIKNPNMNTQDKRGKDIFTLAKEIRKEGEAWKDALQRAKTMRK
jgi:hypothetical protein